MNLVIYGWICWIAFWCIREGVGTERVFMVGLFGNILLWPFRMLLPYWDAAIHCIGAFGLVVALIAALTLLRDFSTAGQPTTPV